MINVLEQKMEANMLIEEFITLTIRKQKNIALIAHDSKKKELIEWCEDNKDILKRHFLCGTGTTARMITDKTGLPVKGYNSGPLGGWHSGRSAGPERRRQAGCGRSRQAGRQPVGWPSLSAPSHGTKKAASAAFFYAGIA